MFEFRLIYQGLLLSSDKEAHHSKHKHDIRRYFHPQLVNLWNTKHPLKQRVDSNFLYSSHRGPEAGVTGLERLATNFRIGDRKILPVVTRDDFLVCGVDILLLRRDFTSVVNSGDLDNRIKTLIDAMRIPSAAEIVEGPENPLCCVMEDDKLISEIRVLADYLFADPEQLVHSPKMSPVTGEYKIKENHVIAVVHVTVKATRHAPGNVEFL
jgi:hypothetical protein